jgi:hypothetical protein
MRGKKFKGLVGISSLVAVGSIAFAAHATSSGLTRLTGVEVTGTNFVILHTEARITSGRPACHFPLAEDSYSIDVSTTKGKALLQVAQAAFLANKKVAITGGTPCYASIEAVSSLYVYAQ